MPAAEKRGGRWWRRGLVLLVGLAALLVAAALVVPMFIPWDRVKAQAEQKISQTLKRRVTIGRVGFQVWRGFEVRDLRIENAEGFSKQPFFTDDLVSVQYRLLPLLLGRVVFKSIRFEKPNLLVERQPDGRWNFSDWIPAKPEAEADTPAGRSLPASLPLELLVSDFSLAQAEFAFRDLAKAQEYRVSDLNVTVANLTLAGLTPVTVELSAKARALGQDYPVNLKLVWRFAYRQGRLDVDQLDLRLPGVVLAAAGKVEQALHEPQVHLSGKIDLDWAAVQKGLLPPGVRAKLPSGLRLTGTTAMTFNCNGPAEPWTSLKADVADETRLTFQRGPASLPLVFQGTAALEAGRLELKRTLDGAAGQAKLVLNLDDLPGRRLVEASWSGTLKLEELQRFLRPEGPQASGQVALEARARGSLAEPGRMDFSADAHAQGVGVRAGEKVLLEQLEAQVRLDPTHVKITRLSGQIAGQSLNATLNAEGFDLRQPETLKPQSTAARVQWSLSGKVLEVETLLALLSRPAAAASTTPVAAVAAAEELPEPDARAWLPPKLEVTGRAKLEGLRFGKLTLGAMDLDQKLKNRVLTLKGTMQGYQGKLTHATALDCTSTLLGYDLTVKPERVDLEPMLNDLLDTFVAARLKKPELLNQLKNKFVGRLTGSLQVAGRGLRQAQLRPGLTGKGHFELRDGLIRKFDFQDQLAAWFGSDKFRQDIPFERADLDFTLAQETVTVSRFTAESGPTGEAGDIRLTANGPITFKADFRDFKLQPHLSPRAAHNLSTDLSRYAEVLKDDKGWVTIPARLNGPVAKPEVRPDLDWIKTQAGSYVQKKTQAAAQEAQQKINQYVEKQKGKSAEEVKDNAAKELEKAKEQLKKLNLQNIFK